MKTLALKLAKRPKLWLLISLANTFLFVSLLLWFFVEIPITKWGFTKVTSHNALEAVWITKQELVWQKTLERIEVINNKEVKKILLHLYIQLIPVDQWWNPLYPILEQASNEYSQILIEDGDWFDLGLLSEHMHEIDDRKSRFLFNMGYAAEMLNSDDEAIKYYYEALLIESTNIPAIKQLTNILIQRGDYMDAKQVIDHFVSVTNVARNEVCIYWGKDGFAAGMYKCLPVSSMGKTLRLVVDNSGLIRDNFSKIDHIRIDIPSMSQLQIDELRVQVRGNKLAIRWDSLEDWLLHQATLRDTTVLSANGDDAYVYTSFNEIDINDIEHIELEFVLSKYYQDDELEEIIARINSALTNE